MKAMMIGAVGFIASLVILTVSALGYATQPKGECYSAWSESGIHLILSDNGTPDDVEDDFICDWETNREFTIDISR